MLINENFICNGNKIKRKEDLNNMLANPLSVVEFNKGSFVIFDTPTNHNIDLYIREFKKLNITHVVRLCEATYDKQKILSAGMELTELLFSEESLPPPRNVLSTWRRIINNVSEGGGNVGVHCMSGLSRAPLLVAIYLIDNGMEASEAINLIQSKRNGAITSTQRNWLLNYKKHCTIC